MLSNARECREQNTRAQHARTRKQHALDVRLFVTIDAHMFAACAPNDQRTNGPTNRTYTTNPFFDADEDDDSAALADVDDVDEADVAVESNELCARANQANNASEILCRQHTNRFIR